jgi:Kef-type K+ transport system membrane component KefB
MSGMTTQQATTLLLSLATITLVARLCGALAQRVAQPAVIGEVVAGVLLGPTLFHGAIARNLFPVDIRPFLGALANVGVVVFMFVVGLEVDRALLRGKGRLAVTVSLSSILLPFGLGVLLSLYLAVNHPPDDRLGFMLFIGAAMSVTAFPVLARILTDRNLHRTSLGGLALTCAAVDDLFAWSLLAVVVAVAGADGDPWRLLLLAPYLAVMLWLVRPLLRRLLVGHRRADRLSEGTLAVVLAGALLSAATTEWMGLHFIFGAFLFGILMPHDTGGRLAEEIRDRVSHVSAVLLLPVFFVVAGLNVNLAQVRLIGLYELVLILVVAIGGKFVGALVGARLNRVPTRQSAALAVLMNTRGLTELIILSVGLQLHIIDARLYSLMVVMAVVTTVMAGPLLNMIYPTKHHVLAEPSGRPRPAEVGC